MVSQPVPKDLSSWLDHIERLHPKSIAMGLERVQRVIQRLKLKPDFVAITVAGTNGKGSTCAMLAQIYHQAGYKVGCYTSPHLLRYNERVKVNGNEVDDRSLCEAFEAVESARRDAGDEIPLTYFEVGTLAAVWHFVQTGVDVAILEIGLGGRLDAVNAFKPDCSIVTAVDLDHQEFLGDDREKIAYEKAGVYRKDTPAICGDNDPPGSLIEYAGSIHANFRCINQDFNWNDSGDGWQYLSQGHVIHALPLPALQGKYQLNNAACAVAAVESLQGRLPVATESIAEAMRQVTVAGRFQKVSDKPLTILDVAHNPQAARALADNLAAIRLQQQSNHPGKKAGLGTVAVFAMLSDKDIDGVVEAVKDEIDAWYVASIEHIRGARASDLAAVIAAASPAARIELFNTPAEAYAHARADIEACIDGNENDKIIAFGSFFTVAGVMQYINESGVSHLKGCSNAT